MPLSLFRGLLLSLLFLSFLGCNRYAFSVNSKEIYRPPPLYAEFAVADQALAACLEQTILDQRITDVRQLKTLRCTHAGITNLQGLAHFAWLESVDLSNNDIVRSAPLADLPRLAILRIEGNAQLDCKAALLLRPRLGERLKLPAHCRHL